MRFPCRSILALAFALVAAAIPAAAQCPNWTSHPFDSSVFVLEELDFQGTRSLYAGGNFSSPAGQAGLARWDGGAWNPVGPPALLLQNGLPGAIQAMTVFPDTTGPVLVVAGLFNSIGGVAANGIARWNGTSWAPFGGGLVGVGGSGGDVSNVAVYDSGNGPELYAAGAFTAPPNIHCARWDGTNWVPLGSGIGLITSPVNGAVLSFVSALRVYDDGSGSKLYVGGRFDVAGGVTSHSLARWTGSAWEATPGFATGWLVFDLEPWNGALRIGAHTGLYQWDGVQVQSVAALSPITTSSGVFALSRHVENGTWRLDVAGKFTSIGGVAADRVASFDGANWTSLGFGPVTGLLQDIERTDVGGAGLFVGYSTGPAEPPAPHVEAWTPCPDAQVLCAGDGSGLACPCANSGAVGHGCANSAFASGAALVGAGTNSVAEDGFSLQAANLTGSVCLFFQGTTAVTPTVIDDGIGCVGGGIVRLGTKPVVGSASRYPQSGDAAIHVRGAVPAVGGTFVYQAFYRNAVTGFCPPATSNRTNGLSVTWAP